jgi:hypothetical protein
MAVAPKSATITAAVIMKIWRIFIAPSKKVGSPRPSRTCSRLVDRANFMFQSF